MSESLFKKEGLAQVLSCEFCDIFKNTFFIEHLLWLLLKLQRRIWVIVEEAPLGMENGKERML